MDRIDRFFVKLTAEQHAAQLEKAKAEIDTRVKEEQAAAAARPPPRGPGRPPTLGRVAPNSE